MRRADRAAATRTRIVAVAVDMFTARGFRGTTIEAVQEEARVSRGALYHHFANKEVLFEAVYETVEEDTAQAIAAAAENAPEAPLRAGCAAWLDRAGDPEVRQITLLDGPAVIGWDRWSTTEDRRGLGMLRRAFAREAELGRLDPDLVEPVAHMVLAALIELGLMISRSEHPAATQRLARAALDHLLARLLGPSEHVRHGMHRA
jgi:AcrR family transcriptional regulator